MTKKMKWKKVESKKKKMVLVQMVPGNHDIFSLYLREKNLEMRKLRDER